MDPRLKVIKAFDRETSTYSPQNYEANQEHGDGRLGRRRKKSQQHPVTEYISDR